MERLGTVRKPVLGIKLIKKCGTGVGEDLRIAMRRK